MLITVATLVVSLGLTSSVYAFDLVGYGTSSATAEAAQKASAYQKADSSTSSASTAGQGSTASAGTTSSGTTSSEDNSGSDALVSQRAAVTTTTTSSVQTGYLDEHLPLIISLCASVVLLFLFGRGMLGHVRRGKSSVYAEEMQEFRRRCNS